MKSTCHALAAAGSALLLAGLSAPATAQIEFDNGFNFREIRIDPPLNYRQGPDHFIFGVDITDGATGQAPAGAVARARNTNTGEEIVLRPFGVEFSEFADYSPATADGDWVIEVNSDIGSASVLLPAFGTGPGTGAMPGVQNLAVAPGAQPVMTWDLPPDLPASNDGNVDRIRARINDSNGLTLIDDRFDNTASATRYTTPNGIVTHNGAYVAQVMVEGIDPFSRSRAFETFVVDDVALGGGPVDLGDDFFFRDFRGPNSVGFGQGDLLTLGAEVDVFDETYVHGTNDGVIVPISQANETNRRFEFATSFAYDPALTDPWTLVAWNGAVESRLQTHAVGDAQALPLVQNIRIEPDFLTPTIRWDLPADNTAPVERVRIGLFDDVTDDRLSVFGPGQDQLFEVLAADATSYRFAPGVLREGGRYVVRVLLNGRNAEGIQTNRSVTFFNFTPILETGVGEVFLPTLDEGGIYNFDFDVTAAVPVVIDPVVAVGYEYAIGAGNPRFASVSLPLAGDGLYDLVLFDATGNRLPAVQLAAGVTFDFTTVDPDGVARFVVEGIEVGAGLDPADVTAFMTTVSFAGSGRFTGTMTPITVEIPQTAAGIDSLLADVQALVDDGRLAARRGEDLQALLQRALLDIDAGAQPGRVCGWLVTFDEDVARLAWNAVLDPADGDALAGASAGVQELLGCAFCEIIH